MKAILNLFLCQKFISSCTFFSYKNRISLYIFFYNFILYFSIIWELKSLALISDILVLWFQVQVPFWKFSFRAIWTLIPLYGKKKKDIIKAPLAKHHCWTRRYQTEFKKTINRCQNRSDRMLEFSARCFNTTITKML